MNVKLFTTAEELKEPSKAHKEDVVHVEVNVNGSVFEMHERNGRLIVLVDGTLIVRPIAGNMIRLDIE